MQRCFVKVHMAMSILYPSMRQCRSPQKGLAWASPFTQPGLAIQLAGGAILLVKMAIQDLISPVAAIQLAAGAFPSVKIEHPGFDKPCCC